MSPTFLFFATGALAAVLHGVKPIPTLPRRGMLVLVNVSS